MKIYLSEAISNNLDKYEKEFSDKERVLINGGFEVHNPVAHNKYLGCRTYEEFMKESIRALLNCDAIYTVNDTTFSGGAILEHIIAKAIGLRDMSHHKEGLS